jgi:hypothetical protein
LPDSDTKDLKSAVNPKTNQVKHNETGNTECQNEKWPSQNESWPFHPLGKDALGRYQLFRFERLFVNGRAVLILDPSCLSLGPLVFDNCKRAFRIVGFRFDYPIRHGGKLPFLMLQVCG